MNELLRQLLVMDVSRSGSLSYDEWTRAMLSLPEVLACFQLASVVSQPVPMHHAGAPLVDDDLLRRRFGERGAAEHRADASAAAAALMASNLAPGHHLSPAAASGLWWRSMWRSLAGVTTCAACAQ